MLETYEIRVRKNDLSDAGAVALGVAPLQAGEARLRVDRAALTANNVTYAAMGEPFGYWRFFPTIEGFGIVPIWGFADVVESRAEGVPIGARVWGYYPLANSLVVSPSRVNARGFDDGALHRAALPPVYNRYEFVPAREAREEALEALFRPLFMTSFVIDDHFAAHDWFGARQVVFASASSKTALGAAFLMRARGRVETVALTSSRNAAFCEGVGAYVRVVAYDRVAEMPMDAPTALIDMAGDAAVVNALAARLGTAFIHNAIVGATHWDVERQAVNGPQQALFFAPDVIARRTKELGPEAFQERYLSAWGAMREKFNWLDLKEAVGPDAMIGEWRRQLAGEVGPTEGVILRP